MDCFCVSMRLEAISIALKCLSVSMNKQIYKSNLLHGLAEFAQNHTEVSRSCLHTAQKIMKEGILAANISTTQ